VDSPVPDFGHSLTEKVNSGKLERGAIKSGLVCGHDQVRLRQASLMAAKTLHDFPADQQPGKQPFNVCHHLCSDVQNISEIARFSFDYT